MPANWTPAALLGIPDNAERYEGRFDADTDPHEAWDTYMRMRLGIDEEETALPTAALPPEFMVQVDPALLIQLGIDPVQFQNAQLERAEQMQGILEALGVQTPAQQQSAESVNQVALQEINEWPRRERFLLLNPLSQFWTWEAVQERPARVGTLAQLYVLGMVGYTLALPFRIMVFIKELLHLPIAFFNNLCMERGHNFFETMKVRFLCLGGATGELISGAIGVACPPIAYWIDEKIQENSIIRRNSRFRGAWVEPGRNLGEAIENMFSGNFDRIALKAEEMQHLQPNLDLALRQLQRYFKDDALAGQDVETFFQIGLIGMLQAYRLNPDSDFLDPMHIILIAYHPELCFYQDNPDSVYMNGLGQVIAEGEEGANSLGFLNNWKDYREQWQILIEQGNDPIGLIDFLILRAIQNTAESLDEDSYKNGQQEVLEDALDRPLENPAFEALYQALSGMNNAILSSDGELFGVVGQLSGLKALAEESVRRDEEVGSGL